MLPKPLIFFVVLMTGFGASAQKGFVQGILHDGGSTPLPDATVSVLRSSDSTLISFSLSSNSGFFQIKNLDTGRYYMNASYQGLEPIVKSFRLSADSLAKDFGILKLDKAYKTLDEVLIKDVAPIKVKGDTIAYNADAFKTKPDATVEDLLKKLPGVQVERDGTVKAQGEQVQRVYVDGKEFFSNDPKLATKNLTADMIQEVEVYDDVSEQSRFNRIDDGSRTKAINLKLKKDKKKGLFGRASAGYGTQDRYETALSANYFKGSTQANVIARANNTNNIGFTLTDAVGIMGNNNNPGGGNNNNRNAAAGGMQNIMGGAGTIGVGGNGGFTPGTTGNGITSSAQAGINYRDQWGAKAQVNGSYFFNRTGIENLRQAYCQTFLTDSTINRESRTASQTGNNNHRFNFNVVWQLDSLNSIIYNPNINLQQTESLRDDTISQRADAGLFDYLLSTTHTINNNEGSASNFTNNLTWRRRFRKWGRTFSLAVNNTVSINDRDGLVQSANRFFNRSGANIRNNNFRQNNLQDVGSLLWNITASYTEAIWRNQILEFNYNYNSNLNESKRQTWDYNSATDKYDRFNTGLSNHFKNRNTGHRLGTNFRVTQRKYNYQVGVSWQELELNNRNYSKDTTLTQRFVNLFPRAVFNYQFSRAKTLRINYNGRTNQPNINQLQDVPDLTAAPNIRTGNPALKQEFINNLTVGYNNFNVVKNRSVFVFVNFQNWYNRIVDSIRTLPGGAQFIRPANLGGTFNLTGNISLGVPLHFVKGLRISTNSRGGLVRNGNFTDGIKNYNTNFILGEQLQVFYNYKEVLDATVGASVNYNSTQYSISQTKAGATQPTTSFITYLYSADVTWQLPKDFILTTEFDYNINRGSGTGFNQEFAMWNASFGKRLLKNKRGELKLSVFDILNQNQSFSRNVGENYVEDVQALVLRRFAMLSFTYNLNRMGGRNIPAMGGERRRPRSNGGMRRQ